MSALLSLNRQTKPERLVSMLGHNSLEATEMVTFTDTEKTIVYACQLRRHLMKLLGGIETDAELVRIEQTRKAVCVSIVNGTAIYLKGEKKLSSPFPMNTQTTITIK